MRVSNKMMFEKVIDHLGQNREKMYLLQEKAASQKNINKISDDPLGASRSMAAKGDIKKSNQSIKNINYSLSFLKTTDYALKELNEVLLSMKDIALSQANDPTSSSETRWLMGNQVAQVLQQVAQIGNRKLGDRFIFGGFKTTSAPFDPQGVYHGDSGEILVSVDSKVFMPINLTGDYVFTGQGQSMNSGGKGAQISDIISGNIFHVIRNLEASLKENQSLGIQNSIEALDQLISRLISARSQVGSRISRLESLLESVKKMKINNQELISTIEDVDLFELVNEIQKTENTMQAVLDTSGRLVSKDLMDFLR